MKHEMLPFNLFQENSGKEMVQCLDSRLLLLSLLSFLKEAKEQFIPQSNAFEWWEIIKEGSFSVFLFYG
jgi:hypothetical protein